MTPLMATGIVSPSRAPLGTRSVIDYEANECSFKYSTGVGLRYKSYLSIV